jgi:dihydroneopterin aldolase
LERDRDKICLRGLSFFAYHGVMPEEITLGQRFLVDADLYKCLRAAGQSDQVEDTINYAEVYQTIQAVVTGERYNLLERLAERVADQILQKFSCDGVRIVVHKPGAPIAGIFEDVAIEIYRERKK